MDLWKPQVISSSEKRGGATFVSYLLAFKTPSWGSSSCLEFEKEEKNAAQN